MTRRSQDFLAAAAALDEPADAAPGSPRPSPGSAPETIDRGEVWDALATVIDPEIGLDIVTLGLVYSLEITEDAVRVTFSLTTPGCPMEEAITGGIVNAVGAVCGVEHVLPNLVWEPRWNAGMIEEGAW
jgi:metal-sulfur cluster biosynthetic enzyme